MRLKDFLVFIVTKIIETTCFEMQFSCLIEINTKLYYYYFSTLQSTCSKSMGYGKYENHCQNNLSAYKNHNLANA